MTFSELLENPGLMLLKCISGSRAYNLELPGSDTDIKGIFVLPKLELYGWQRTEQVANESHDEVYFEVGRFMELLVKNNPNILELLSSPAGSTLFRHPLTELIRPEDYLSKLCLDSFAGYAKTQIKKAKGLNKKINRPVEQPRKQVMDFCYVLQASGTTSLHDWLAERAFRQEDCGLVSVPHFRDAYLLYHNSQLPAGQLLQGIVSKAAASDVSLSSVSKGIDSMAVMHFNKDGYSVYCREYSEYWQWVSNRNDARYRNTLSHGRNYDSKNMMHTFRLLAMAEEIALYKKVVVHRPDRDFLLRIRRGEFEYGELLLLAEEKMHRNEVLYQTADLPDTPDAAKAVALLCHIREKFYANYAN